MPRRNAGRARFAVDPGIRAGIAFGDEKVETFGADVPMRRPGQPDEVAPCYVFLASADASYISGQVLRPNGGEIVA